MSTKENTGPETILQPYLFFNGRCEEAIEFYKSAVGAEVVLLMRFKDSPDPTMCTPGIDPEKVMHSTLRIGNTIVQASDGRCEGQLTFQGFGLSLTAPNAAEAERLFARLSEGGEVRMPLTKTFFAPSFGMVADRFGVLWMTLAAA